MGRRCGRRSFHIQKMQCASCGFPQKKMRRYNWSEKALRRRTTGTGRCRYLKTIHKKIQKRLQNQGRLLQRTRNWCQSKLNSKLTGKLTGKKKKKTVKVFFYHIIVCTLIHSLYQKK